jgi:citryl-CoA lyase
LRKEREKMADDKWGDQYDQTGREPFHWQSSISYKTADKIVLRGYDTTEMAEAGWSFAAAVFLLFQGRLPKINEEKMLNFFMVEFMEHAMSPSTLTARCCASGRPALNAAIAAGIMTFGEAHGPGHLHGIMVHKYMEMGEKNGWNLTQIAEQLVKDHKGKLIMGLGQPQHIHGDPRAIRIMKMARELGVAGKFHDLQIEIEKAFEKINGKKVWTNVIGGGNSVFMDLGFSPLAAWAIGVLCRGFSCAAHAMEEMTREKAWRASRTTKMINLLDLSIQGPKYYDGPPDKPVPKPGDRKE